MQRIERHTEMRQREKRKIRAGKNLLRRKTKSAAVVIYGKDNGEGKNEVTESWRIMEGGHRKRGQDRRNVVS